MAKFNNTTFREGYNPSFPEFKKSHQSVIALADMEVAYEVVTGKKISKKQKESLKKEINGDTSPAAEQSTGSESPELD